MGIGWFIFKGILDVVVNTNMRILGSDYLYHPTQLVFFYSFAATIVYLPAVLGNPSAYKPQRWNIYILRGVMEVLGFLLIFMAITRLPFATFTSLTFITPVIASMAAVIFLKEQMLPRKWIGLVLGFIGVLIIAQPNGEGINWAALMVVGAGCCFSICAISIRSLARTDEPSRIACVSMGFMALFSLPFALPHWQTPTIDHLPYLTVMALCAAMVQFSVGKALQKVEVTTVQPLNFLTLIWSSIVGYMLFDETVAWSTILGAVIIISGIIFSIRRSVKRSEAFITTQPLP